ncbi:MAG: hypothetical protein JXK94_01950 [Deltaproteobacteria bacterium]|nr:hypothetical protein [Deltaproteobacteria bacterium]
MFFKKIPFLSLTTLLISSIAQLPNFSSQCLAEIAIFDHPHVLQTDSGPVLNPNNFLVAVAGPDQLADEKSKVFLDASNSWPLNVATSLVFWKQLEGPPVQLSNPEDVRPFFITPEVGPEGAALVFELTLATDDVTTKDTCVVNVSWGNIQPTADAGEDMLVKQGDQVFLDGSGSLDADGEKEELHYQWRQTSGPSVVLSDATTIKPSFIAPYTLHPADTLTFDLDVTDKGGLKANDSIIVNVSWEQPVLEADAGPDKVADEGSRIVLDASKSLSQPEKISRYFWTQLQGPPVTLSDPTAVRPIFLTPSVKNFETANLVFELTITSESGLMATSKTHIRIDDNWFTSFSQEAFVVPLKTKGIGFEVERGGRIVDLSPSRPPTDFKVRDQDIPYGLFDIKIRTYKPGGEAPLKVYFPDPVPEDYQWFKCGKGTGGTPVPISAVVDPERTTFTIFLRDGDASDEDGIQNSLIRDPSGLGGPSIFLGNTLSKSRKFQPNSANPENSPIEGFGGRADFSPKKLLALIFGRFTDFSGPSNSHNPEVNNLSTSSEGWKWLSLQFGPALPLMLLGIIGFISIVFLKKIIGALVSHKDNP